MFQSKILGLGLFAAILILSATNSRSQPAPSGIIWMEDNGDLRLALGYIDRNNNGEAVTTITPDDADYQDILAEVGGLKPGISKPYPPLEKNVPTEISIGEARMEQDGTIILDLHSSDNGMHADGRFTYKRDDPQYNDVLKHAKGLKPGVTVPVSPWK